jgi:DNA-binding NarL/FixJ family response regulator
VAGHQHPQAVALSARSTALVAAARGQLSTAAQQFRLAVGEFDRLDLTFEAGRTRLELASALAATEPVLAVVEGRHAAEQLHRIGAAGEAARAALLLRSLGVPTRAGPRRTGALSQREREVLHLVERGLTNPQIAERLYISRKTVAHHVSSILAKLDVGSRTEAAAHAAREGDTQRWLS